MSNQDDCDDTDATNYPGAICDIECNSTFDESCNCVSIDSDTDGVCDKLDQCPGENDDIDNNGNGTPDCAEK